MNDVFEAVGGAIAGIMALVGIVGFFTVGFSILVWILQSLGLYTIAQRRGIKHAWMAWIPVTVMWILGSISDQYYYVAQGKVKNRRKWLVALAIVTFVLSLATGIAQIANTLNLASQMYKGNGNLNMDHTQLALMMIPQLAGGFLVWCVGIWSMVLQHMSLYGLYASCDPMNKTVFTVLGIFIPITMPFFVFACRNKDAGMPPRKAAPAAEPVAPAKIPAPVKAETEEDPVNVNHVEE